MLRRRSHSENTVYRVSQGEKKLFLKWTRVDWPIIFPSSNKRFRYCSGYVLLTIFTGGKWKTQVIAIYRIYTLEDFGGQHFFECPFSLLCCRDQKPTLSPSFRARDLILSSLIPIPLSVTSKAFFEPPQIRESKLGLLQEFTSLYENWILKEEKKWREGEKERERERERERPAPF